MSEDDEFTYDWYMRLHPAEKRITQMYLLLLAYGPTPFLPLLCWALHGRLFNLLVHLAALTTFIYLLNNVVPYRHDGKALLTFWFILGTHALLTAIFTLRSTPDQTEELPVYEEKLKSPTSMQRKRSWSRPPTYSSQV